MAGASHRLRILNRRARRLERAARHLPIAYQRTYTDDTVREVEADELHLDYVIALEALLISPKDDREGIANNIRSRASALFLTPERQKAVGDIVHRAYKPRSAYVHGDVIKNQTEQDKLEELRTLRLLTRQIILRRLVLTPSDTGGCRPGHRPRRTHRSPPARLLHHHPAQQPARRHHRHLAPGGKLRCPPAPHPRRLGDTARRQKFRPR
ncbi:hypothetical protein AB0L74_32720 [Streptomyces sp. NPDC052020]|uniref:hypothetical protein n=1 Tax=Streptomyces sp. NPDC052020 TaxID=3155677 RepID=UPI003443E374